MTEPFEVIPLAPLRKAIAARMMHAAQSIPHFRIAIDVQIDALQELRRLLRARQPQGLPSLNDFFVKACASTLMEVPEVNIQWADTVIHRYRTVDISVVTAVKDGVLTPIVRGAESKSIWDLAREIKDLTVRAAGNALKVTEITGGTFSISNLGMYGVDEFDAIINAPQCAILAIGAARPRLVVSASSSEPVRPAMVARMTLSVDHRAIDGVIAARFLTALRARLEDPKAMQSVVDSKGVSRWES